MGFSLGYGRIDHEMRRVAADQVVLGHLLPRYQAAQDWQAAVRATAACRIVEQPVESEGVNPEPHHGNAFLQAIGRWWRPTLAHRVPPIRLAPSDGCRK